MKNYLKILKLDSEKIVTYNKVRRAYRYLAKNTHPDIHTIPSLKLESMNNFINIKKAHDYLINHIQKHGQIHTFDSKSNAKLFENIQDNTKYTDKIYETKIDKFFFEMPLIIIFGPSLLISYFTIGILGVLFFGIPGYFIHLFGKTIFKNNWLRIAERYIFVPLCFILPVFVYALPVVAIMKKSGINWLQIYIWWAIMSPTMLYLLCCQIESFIIIKKKKSKLPSIS